MEKNDFKFAVVQMLKQYWSDKGLKHSDKVSPNRKYTKKYFDGMDPTGPTPEEKELKKTDAV